MKMLAARDKYGDLYIFNTKDKEDIYKGEDMWHSATLYVEFIQISSTFLPNVKWEDEEPTEVELTVEVK